MGDIKIITVERNSKLKREDVRKAVAEAFSNYKKFKPKPEPQRSKTTGKGKKKA